MNTQAIKFLAENILRETKEEEEIGKLAKLIIALCGTIEEMSRKSTECPTPSHVPTHPPCPPKSAKKYDDGLIKAMGKSSRFWLISGYVWDTQNQSWIYSQRELYDAKYMECEHGPTSQRVFKIIKGGGRAVTAEWLEKVLKSKKGNRYWNVTEIKGEGQ